MRQLHNIKILPEFFVPVREGLKTFEIRFSDRNYKVGDILILNEWTSDGYTGRNVTREITYMTSALQQPGYVVMSIVPVQSGAV